MAIQLLHLIILLHRLIARVGVHLDGWGGPRLGGRLGLLGRAGRRKRWVKAEPPKKENELQEVEYTALSEGHKHVYSSTGSTQHNVICGFPHDDEARQIRAPTRSHMAYPGGCLFCPSFGLVVRST